MTSLEDRFRIRESPENDPNEAKLMRDLDYFSDQSVPLRFEI